MKAINTNMNSEMNEVNANVNTTSAYPYHPYPYHPKWRNTLV